MAKRLKESPVLILKQNQVKLKADGLSVQIEALVDNIDLIVDRSKQTAAFLLAKIPLDLGKECIHDPTDAEYAHALIVGDTNKIARKLAKECHRILDEDITN